MRVLEDTDEVVGVGADGEDAVEGDEKVAAENVGAITSAKGTP